MKKFPNSRIGWHEHYASRFSKGESTAAEQLACWYLLLHLAFDKGSAEVQS